MSADNVLTFTATGEVLDRCAPTDLNRAKNSVLTFKHYELALMLNNINDFEKH